MFICEIWNIRFFVFISANLIRRSLYISKCFREALGIRDNESRQYFSLHRVASLRAGPCSAIGRASDS